MDEHTPPRALIFVMSVFFWALSLSALLFWSGALIWRGGMGGLIESLGDGIVTGFVTLHIPAAIAGLLLLQWKRDAMPVRRRVLLEAATLYFGLAVLFGMFMSYVAVSVLQSFFN